MAPWIFIGIVGLVLVAVVRRVGDWLDQRSRPKMTPDEAYELVQNHDYPEGLRRKFAPGYSLIQINRDGSIACVERFKERPTESEQLALFNKHPGTIQINGNPELYESAEAFRNRVQNSMYLFAIMRR